MEELNLNKEGSLLSEEEFKDKLEERRQLMMENIKKGVLYLRDYSCTRKFKSVRRAIKRGHISIFGDIYPRRPFNNRGTKDQKLKREIYAELKHKQGRV